MRVNSPIPSVNLIKNSRSAIKDFARAHRQLDIHQIVCADLSVYLADKHATFDIIFARDVIEHFKKDEVLEIFCASYQALKPGGVLIVQVPNGESPFSGRIRYGDFARR